MCTSVCTRVHTRVCACVRTRAWCACGGIWGACMRLREAFRLPCPSARALSLACGACGSQAPRDSGSSWDPTAGWTPSLAAACSAGHGGLYVHPAPPAAVPGLLGRGAAVQRGVPAASLGAGDTGEGTSQPRACIRDLSIRGRLEEALTLCRRSLSLTPNDQMTVRTTPQAPGTLVKAAAPPTEARSWSSVRAGQGDARPAPRRVPGAQRLFSGRALSSLPERAVKLLRVLLRRAGPPEHLPRSLGPGHKDAPQTTWKCRAPWLAGQEGTQGAGGLEWSREPRSPSRESPGVHCSAPLLRNNFRTGSSLQPERLVGTVASELGFLSSVEEPSPKDGLVVIATCGSSQKAGRQSSSSRGREAWASRARQCAVV